MSGAQWVDLAFIVWWLALAVIVVLAMARRGVRNVTRMTPRVPRVLLYDGSGRPPLFIPNVYFGRQMIGLGIRLWRLRRYRQTSYRILSIVWARPGRPVTEPGGSGS